MMLSKIVPFFFQISQDDKHVIIENIKLSICNSATLDKYIRGHFIDSLLPEFTDNYFFKCVANGKVRMIFS